MRETAPLALYDGDKQELIADEINLPEDEFQKHFDRMPFAVTTKKIEQLPHWVQVADVFKSDSDRPFLKRSGFTNLDDPRAEKYHRYATQGPACCGQRPLSYPAVAPSPPAPLCHEGRKS